MNTILQKLMRITGSSKLNFKNRLKLIYAVIIVIRVLDLHNKYLLSLFCSSGCMHRFVHQLNVFEF